MSEYITKVELDFNGSVITDFKSFTEKKIDLGKTVELVNKTGYAQTTPRYGFELEYVVPKIGAFDFSPMVAESGLVTVYRSGGSKVTYSGVRLLSKGDGKADGKDEITHVYEFMAEDRDPAL